MSNASVKSFIAGSFVATVSRSLLQVVDRVQRQLALQQQLLERVGGSAEPVESTWKSQAGMRILRPRESRVCSRGAGVGRRERGARNRAASLLAAHSPGPRREREYVIRSGCAPACVSSLGTARVAYAGGCPSCGSWRLPGARPLPSRIQCLRWRS